MRNGPTKQATILWPPGWAAARGPGPGGAAPLRLGSVPTHSGRGLAAAAVTAGQSRLRPGCALAAARSLFRAARCPFASEPCAVRIIATHH